MHLFLLSIGRRRSKKRTFRKEGIKSGSIGLRRIVKATQRKKPAKTRIFNIGAETAEVDAKMRRGKCIQEKEEIGHVQTSDRGRKVKAWKEELRGDAIGRHEARERRSHRGFSA